jgi:hypothetical protein
MKLGRNNFDLLETGGAKMVSDPIGGPLDIRLVLGLSANGGNAKKLTEFAEMLFATTLDKFSQVHIRPSGTRIRIRKKLSIITRKARRRNGTGAKSWMPLPLVLFYGLPEPCTRFGGRDRLAEWGTPVQKGN